MFEWFKFNSHIQQKVEPADAFITDVHTMAGQCKCGTFKDELIRDNILVGMIDAKLSETPAQTESNSSRNSHLSKAD